jgi:hypothetical protein
MIFSTPDRRIPDPVPWVKNAPDPGTATLHHMRFPVGTVQYRYPYVFTFYEYLFVYRTLEHISSIQ